MQDSMVLFTRWGMGDAPAELQQKLAGILLNLLKQDTAPGVIAFYGDGVKLACEGSPALDQLLDQVRVGIIGGMGDIVAAMKSAAKVIGV